MTYLGSPSRGAELIATAREGGADDWLANSSSDSGRKSISSVLPTTPCQPRSRMRSIISTRLAPASARSPPWRIKSGEVCCRSTRTASNAVRFPWMSDRIAIRITEFYGLAALQRKLSLFVLVGNSETIPWA
jgi:hypothetical protein